MPHPFKPCWLASICLVLAAMTGCSGYALEGRVIRGSTASVIVVDRDDPRLTESNPTGGGAVVQAVFEPNTPTETQSLGQHVTDGQGRFKIPIDAFGVGVLEYEAQVVARREGHQGAMALIDLPGSGKRVLIILPLGRDTLVVPEAFLDQAMREAQPYLDQNQ
ncbi:MAG: hypothetical protein ACPGYV_00030 [Phycisphaeraceae bacterium]